MAAFTTIAALGMSAAGSAFSFLQAGKQSKIENQAQRDAAKYMADARKKLDVNMLKGLNLSRDAYDLESEQLSQFAGAGLQAGVEGDQRGAGAAVGRVGQLLSEQAKEQRVAMAKELSDFEMAVAKEDVNLQGQRVDLDLGEVAGQQQIAADARAARAQSMQAGVQGLVDVGLGAMEAGDAFSGTAERRAANKEKRQTKELIEELEDKIKNYGRRIWIRKG